MSAPIGCSAAFLDVLADVKAVASTTCTVLLTGETGTGKEVIARAIHDESDRSRQPFIATNCAALPATLLESELFGHERGAFTGAVTQSPGRFLAAHGGTLFLDEVGELPLELQPKLLRVLQERCFERLGSSRSIHADVRVIAATNQDLETMVREGRFRADLFYRLNVFPISLPALRMREDDIEVLALHFLRNFCRAQGRSSLSIPQSLLIAMRQYSWPGNIRELQNFIERAVIVSTDRELAPRTSDMQRLLSAECTEEVDTLNAAEKHHILRTLQGAGWVVGGRNGAAARLGIPRTTLISKMQKLGIMSKSLTRAPHVSRVRPLQPTGTSSVTVQ